MYTENTDECYMPISFDIMKPQYELFIVSLLFIIDWGVQTAIFKSKLFHVLSLPILDYTQEKKVECLKKELRLFYF